MWATVCLPRALQQCRNMSTSYWSLDTIFQFGTSFIRNAMNYHSSLSKFRLESWKPNAWRSSIRSAKVYSLIDWQNVNLSKTWNHNQRQCPSHARMGSIKEIYENICTDASYWPRWKMAVLCGVHVWLPLWNYFLKLSTVLVRNDLYYMHRLRNWSPHYFENLNETHSLKSGAAIGTQDEMLISEASVQ